MTEADAEDVREELQLSGWNTTGLDDAQIWRFIEDRARPIVQNELAEGNPDYNLSILETLLAGHFILASGIDEVRQAEETTDSDGASARFTGEFGRGFESTTLGQQAVDLDQSGVLSKMSTDTPEMQMDAVGRIPDR